ncbi:alpha-xenorhabdolysin family binary toxin subunit B [Pseudomonas putida]|uniref:alpha-xenorhabdolysin family binary toxin subunit B n=1 Tax=Pseudomonas putida TaxID=303 RepID=UPI00236579E7|nr:alpha-xenorhabdolysin family binary toxin subunit B [Pseudomonas putida]MDD2047856.1 alpha-xenorhabdolysin family binary toxin subunit B [Pseudomonas putida]
MNDNVIALHAALQTPDMAKVLAAASAYSGFWERRTFDFLPLLHTSVERHYKGFLTYVEELAKNAEVLAVGIKSENIEVLLKDLQASGGAPDEEEFLLEEIQRSAGNIRKKVDVLLVGVKSATQSIASLPVYDPNRDRRNYLEAQQQLDSNLQTLTTRLTGKRNELAELEKALQVFEANGIEKQFEGKLPTVEQVQAMVATGATTAGAALAIEQAMEALNKLMGGIQEGMRYSQLQSQRRALRDQVNEMVAEQRDREQRANQLQGYLKALSEYAPLIEKRLEWLAEKNQIRVKLETVRNQLSSLKLQGIESAQLLNKLLVALIAYVRHVVDEYKKAF